MPKLRDRLRFRFPAGRCSMDSGAMHRVVPSHRRTDHPWPRSHAPRLPAPKDGKVWATSCAGCPVGMASAGTTHRTQRRVLVDDEVETPTALCETDIGYVLKAANVSSCAVSRTGRHSGRLALTQSRGLVIALFARRRKEGYGQSAPEEGTCPGDRCSSPRKNGLGSFARRYFPAQPLRRLRTSRITFFARHAWGLHVDSGDNMAEDFLTFHAESYW